MKSKYPKKDSRRFFEQRCQVYDWRKIHRIAAAIAKEFSGQEIEDDTVKWALKIGLGTFIRYSTDFCGEINGYIVTAKAKKKYEEMGRIDAHVTGPHYMEHLIPIGQFTRELIKNPSLENVKKLYKKQQILYTLRTERKEYDKEPFKSYRSNKDIAKFKIKYGVRDLPDMPEEK